ncbi:DUF418 domain-containing protein [Lewinella sp. IMCC34183]|uniref:DUF418 domain-containing protein n=1 Tax=Lewinella sp. IMCC34183 TaxID=2248762 RepID=UPI000E22F61F|nr:DUF418 domain-containing protein [Lewinella sp. IMCC34183]
MPQPRIEAIDALRGFALAGVGLVHFLERFGGGLLAPEALARIDHGWVDLAFRALLWSSFGKFFALFSILFGLSFYLMRQSAAERGESFAARYVWRACLLAGIGFLHQCIYRGDILLIYATLAPLLLLADRLRTRWLLVLVAGCFFSVPRLLSFAIWGDAPVFDAAPVLEADHASVGAYTALLQEGSFGELARRHTTTGLAIKANLYLGVLGRYYYTFGYFLVGLLLGRLRFFARPCYLRGVRRAIVRSSLTGLSVGTVLMLLLFSQAEQPFDWSGWLPVVALNFYDWTNVAVAALLLVWFVNRFQTAAGRRALTMFAPYGRMALTNYVLLSVIGTFLLFDWGLGLFSVLRIHQLGVLAVAVIAVQMTGSALWLRYFQQGPLEWAWRSLTYLGERRLRWRRRAAVPRHRMYPTSDVGIEKRGGVAAK